MKRILTAAALAAGLAFAPAAQAAVLYTLNGSFQADTDGDEGPGATETFNWSFSFQTEDFLTATGEITPDACAISGTFYVCAPTQFVDPTAQSIGGAVTDAFVSFQTSNADGSGGGGAFYFFAQGAFGAYGTYTTDGHPDPSGPTGDGGNVGNAGPATLVVSQVSPVPEPASWAMMIAGFGMAGGALRMRRREAAVALA